MENKFACEKCHKIMTGRQPGFAERKLEGGPTGVVDDFVKLYCEDEDCDNFHEIIKIDNRAYYDEEHGRS